MEPIYLRAWPEIADPGMLGAPGSSTANLVFGLKILIARSSVLSVACPARRSQC
jgi:hypothetical protein